MQLGDYDHVYQLLIYILILVINKMDIVYLPKARTNSSLGFNSICNCSCGHQQKQFGAPTHSVRTGRSGRCNAYTPCRTRLNAKHLVIHPPNTYYQLVYILIHTIS